MQLTFHCGSDEANAQLRLLDVDELRGGDEAWAQIKLASQLAVERGDRFVLRSPNDTVAGGEIVDAAPKRHRRKHVTTIDALEALMRHDPERLLLDAITRTPMIEGGSLSAASTQTAQELAATLETLVQAGGIRAFEDASGTRYATASFVEQAQRQVVEAVEAYHRAHPLRAGVPIEELRARLKLDAPSAAALFGATPAVTVNGATVALASFAPSPSPSQADEIERLLAELREAPFAPPATNIERDLLAYLVDTGAVVAADGIVFEAGSFAAHTKRLREHIEREGSITLAQARDLLACGRRHAQAILEQMDRRRITRRVGDARILR
jgi:selenocysteine-specific elongation factor